ncbi:MAG: hypothetical protein AB7O24_17375 [Kofleriaceae bacterium]
MRGCSSSFLAFVAIIAAGAGACGQVATVSRSASITASAPHQRAGSARVVTIEPPPRHATTEQRLFINVDAIVDRSNRVPSKFSQRLTEVVRKAIQLNGYATSSTGALPTSLELDARGYRGFIVAASVQQVTIERTGSHAEIGCRVTVRVARWSGTDGGERWETRTAANAAGSGRATTAWRDDQVERGVCECIETVVDEVTSRQVVPFLRRVAVLD